MNINDGQNKTITWKMENDLDNKKCLTFSKSYKILVSLEKSLYETLLGYKKYFLNDIL